MEGLSDGRPPDKSAKRDEIILGDKSSERIASLDYQ